MSLFSSGKQVHSNFGEDLLDYYRNRLANGAKNDPVFHKIEQIVNDTRDGKYIFGDGEGLFHNYGEALGKLFGWTTDKAGEALNSFGNGFFETEVGQDIASAANDVYSSGKKMLSGVLPVINEPTANVSGGSGYAGTGSSAHAIDYGNYAPGAQMFGMDRETAYQEFMANTAHQREVADLRAAGLNPVLGISGSGSSVVSGNAAGASSAHKGLNSDALVDVIGATAGLLTTIFTKNPSYGYMVKNVISSGGELLK